MTTSSSRRRQALFTTLDQDRSGTLERADFERAAEAIRAERQWPESHARYQSLLHAMREFWDELRLHVDRDKSGGVSLAEWTRFHDGMADEVRELGRLPLWGLGLLQSIHAVLDLDGDGNVTPEEYALWLKAIGSPHDPVAAFAELDADHDGRIGFDELEQLYRAWLLGEGDGAPGADLFTGARV